MIAASTVRTAVPGLAIERQHGVHSITLVLRGEMDLASAAQVDHAIIDAMSTGPTRIVIDLAGVEFIDSSGLMTLIQARRHADSNGHSLILRHVPAQAKRLFNVAGVADAFVME